MFLFLCQHLPRLRENSTDRVRHKKEAIRVMRIASIILIKNNSCLVWSVLFATADLGWTEKDADWTN